MKTFILTFDGMSFTTDPNQQTDFSMTVAQASEIMVKCDAKGSLPEGVLTIVAARIYRDDADEPDEVEPGEAVQIELTAHIELLVSATDEASAEKTPVPREFLEDIVSHLTGGPCLGFGDTDVFELVDTDESPAVAA